MPRLAKPGDAASCRSDHISQLSKLQAHKLRFVTGGRRLMQVLLYKALGFQIPTFAHMSLILAPDKSKLSKR